MANTIFSYYIYFIAVSIPIIFIPVSIREDEVFKFTFLIFTPFLFKIIFSILRILFTGSFKHKDTKSIQETFVKKVFIVSAVCSAIGAFLLKDDGRPLELFYTIYVLLPILWIILLRFWLLVTTGKFKGDKSE